MTPERPFEKTQWVDVSKIRKDDNKTTVDHENDKNVTVPPTTKSSTNEVDKKPVGTLKA